MTHPLWPLFDLMIRSEHLELRLPSDDELVALAAVARAGIHPSQEMPFGVPWSTLPSPAFERGFVQHHWLMRATWRPDDWMLNLGIFLGGQPIGSQSVGAHQFSIFRTIKTGSWLGLPFQGRGYGKEMRGAVLAFGFDHLGAVRADTDAFIDNARSTGVSRSLGYVEDGLGQLAPEGVARTTQRFRMSGEAWRAMPRDPIRVVDFDGCRDLFGTT